LPPTNTPPQSSNADQEFTQTLIVLLSASEAVELAKEPAKRTTLAVSMTGGRVRQFGVKLRGIKQRNADRENDQRNFL